MKNVVPKNIPLPPCASAKATGGTRSLAHKPYANMPSLKLWQLEKGEYCIKLILLNTIIRHLK